MVRNFWQKRRVFVTGYEGFLGSHLSRALLCRGAKLWGLDILTHRKQTILTNKELNKIKVIKGKAENFSLVSEIVRKNRIEIIFHLAAEALVGECLKNPLRAFSSNIRGTWNILEASRHCDSVKAVIVSSSDKAYGVQSKLPYKEDTPLAGRYPYDVSKSCADLLAHTYFYTYRVPVCISRCGNIFGPGDFHFSRIIPDAIKCALTNKTLLIRSDGKFTRDYIYIKDIVNGYILLAEKVQKLKLFGEAFNFSNEKPISVLELVKTVFKLIGKEPNYKILKQAQFEIKHQYLSVKKAKKILNWTPRYRLKEGLRETIDWYKRIFK